MEKSGLADDVNRRNFALFDSAGALVDWSEGFTDEFSTAKDLIATGASLRALLAQAHADDDDARTDMASGSQFDPAINWTDAEAIEGAVSRIFDYRTSNGRIFRVSEDRTRSGGLMRITCDVTAERRMNAAFTNSDEEWCLDGDPTVESTLRFWILADGSYELGPRDENARTIWGLSADADLTDISLFSRMARSDEEIRENRKKIDEAVKTSRTTWADCRIRDGSNRLRWLRCVITPTGEPDGAILMCLRDITREKFAEDQLELLRSAVTHATDSIHIMHTTRDGLTTTVYANPSFEQLTGWTLKELIGRPIDVMTGWDECWNSILSLPGEAVLELQAQRRDGAPIWLEVGAKVLDRRADDSRRWVVVSRNIDDRRAAQDALYRARDAAEAANSAKSEFLANMSHEIRTPMNGIMGMTGLLLRGDLTVEQRKFAEAVKTSADCLLGIINDILDVSKLEAGKVELEIIDFSLEKVVEDIAELLAPRALDQGLEIVCHLDERARRPLRGDPTRVRQILLNLLSNSLKFTERGFVAVEVVSTEATDGRIGLRIEVSDTGIGLSPEAKSKLFQKFQQADGSITRRFGGTGLGLSICRQLVTLMGGDIGVEDRPGGGSTFWVSIELEPGGDAKNERARGIDLYGLRILVVDDLQINRTIFRRQLEGGGAIVAEAADGETCLKMLERAQANALPFDIVLMDHMMPGMGGDLVAERIRSDTALRQPRLVLASSIGVPLSTERAAGAGFDAFLTKPIRYQVLVDCLSSLIAEAKPERAIEDPVEPEGEHPAVQGRILLVEDNAINTLLATTLLEAAGHSVDAVVNGSDAVDAAQLTWYDLILMDVHMPVMDGLEATRRIRALGDAAASVPILAMTANAMTNDQEACLAAGMDGFVSKPFDAGVFLSAVAHYVERRQADVRLEPPNSARSAAS